MSPTGWKDVQVAWQNVKSSASTLLDDMCLFNLGIINLMGWKNNDDSTETGPSKLLTEGNAEAGPSRVLQNSYNSIEAGQKISQKQMQPESPQQASAAVGPSKASHKQQKIDDGQQRNPFLNLYAAEDKEESTNTDTGSDTPIASPSTVSEVLPARWTTFASHINNICHHYEGGYIRHAGLNVSLGSLCCSSLIFPMSSSDANLHVYKVDVMTAGAASHIQHALQLKSFKVTLDYNHSLYIKATSPKAIKMSLPPSHCSIV
ncbi:hypothetical protein J3A83DRAFT_4371283 [Scleroderma citrinum]